jgi:hypothetical protein
MYVCALPSSLQQRAVSVLHTKMLILSLQYFTRLHASQTQNSELQFVCEIIATQMPNAS